jgi:DNA primase
VHSAMLKITLTIVCLVALAGCDLQPWVKPYERANIADEVMQFDRDPVASSYLEHVYEARESARGAGITTGGGCGCN